MADDHVVQLLHVDIERGGVVQQHPARHRGVEEDVVDVAVPLQAQVQRDAVLGDRVLPLGVEVVGQAGSGHPGFVGQQHVDVVFDHGCDHDAGDTVRHPPDLMRIFLAVDTGIDCIGS